MLSINVGVWDLIKCRLVGLNETFRIRRVGLEGSLGSVLTEIQTPIGKEEELEVRLDFFFCPLSWFQM